MIGKKRLMDWLETLPEDCGVGVDDGGLTLVCDADPEAYLEVGGVPEDVVDLMRSYIDIRFKDPVQPHDIDLGALLITHVSGRSWILNVVSSWGADAPSYRGCHAVKDLETFPKGEEYPYDLTQDDIDSREIRATLFVGGEVERDVISITYDLVDLDGDIIAAGLVAVKEGA